MSSSGKGGSANQSKMVYGSGVIALGWGPWDWLSTVIHNGNYLFQGSLSLTTDVTDLTGAIADPSYLAPGGYLKLRRGTETQSADFTGRRNKGTVTLECRHLLFGQDTGTAPNLQVIGGGLPRVPITIVAAADNVADDGQVNPVACWAEILLDERGGNLPEAVFDAASWLAAGNWAYVNRAFAFVSPMIIEQSPIRAIAKRLLDPFHGFCRWTKDGKLACRVYEWGVDPGGLTTLDARHFTARPRIPLGDWDEVKTELIVSYTDRDYQFQGNTVAVPNGLAAQIRQVDDQGGLARPDVMRRPQAFRHGSEHNRRMGTAPSKATLPLRRPVLDALALTVGDKVKIDTDPEPGGTGLAQLCRVEGLRWGRNDVAQLEVVTDNLVPATVYMPAYTPPSTPAADAPPLVYFLGVPLPPGAFGLPRAVAMLATRPSADVVRFLVYFSNSSGGSYDELGIQAGFAVRAQLAAGIAAGDGTLQLTELDGLSGPDAEIAANTPGGNPTAAANNTLLALICTLDGNGRIALAANGNPIMEFVSIQARSLVSGATHSYTVLRGRLGTTAQAWTTGAVAWIIPRDHLVEWRHELFDGLAGAPAFFRLVSATASAIDDTIPVPQCGVNMLPNSAPMVTAARPEGYYEPNLTNDRHTVACNAEATPLAGELGSGGRAWTDVQAYAASTGLTAVASAPTAGQFSFTAAVLSGTASITKESDSRVRVDTLTSLEAKILITVNFEGSYTAEIEWIVWKNLAGGTYSLVPSASVVKRNNAGAYTPTAVVFSALAKLSAAAPAAYAGRFKIAYWNGSSWVDDYTSAGNESSKSYTPPAGVSKFRCQLYQAGAFSVLLDEEEIPVVDDGAVGPAGTSQFTLLKTSGMTDLGGGAVFKSGGTNGSWDQAVYSQEPFTGGAYCSFKVNQTNHAIMVGLNTDPTADASYTSLDYAWYPNSDSNLYIYENGLQVGSFGPYATSSVYSITYDGAVVRYLVDGVVYRTVEAAPGLKLYLDSSFAHNGTAAQVSSLRFGPMGGAGVGNVTFLNQTGMADLGNGSFKKVAGVNGSWDAAFVSRESFVNGAFLSFTAHQTNSPFMVGLNTDPGTDSNYTSLDYAWYCNGSGITQIFESGSAIATYGAYTTSTVFDITYDGDKVRYYMDGVLKHTTTASAGLRFYLDSSFYNIGGQVNNVRFGPMGAKGSDGLNGTRTAILDMYQWAASAPTSFPTGTASVYTWATGQFTAPGTPNGWSLTPPAPVAGQILYVCRQIYSDSGTSATSNVTWTAGSNMTVSRAGADGANGQRVGVLELYQWAASAPTTMPVGTSTYTWATGAFTAPGTANGWTLTPGAAVAGQTLWGIQVVISNNGTSATSTSPNWNTAGPAYAVGAAGTNGTNGTNGATVIGLGGGGGTVNNTSYADTSPPMLATFDSPGGNRMVQTSASQIVNAGGSAQTVSAGLFVDGSLVAEWIDHLAAGESANFLLSATVSVAAGVGKEARVKFKGAGGGNVAGGTTITVL